MGKRPSKMNTSAESLFEKLKSRSSSSASTSPGKDENSKKKKAKKMPSPPCVRPVDMKSVRVLVERTKFNVMQILDSSRKNSLKLVNGGGQQEKKRGRPMKKRRRKDDTTTHQKNKKSTVNGLFRIRKCYVKIPKDKLLLQLQAKQAAAGVSNKRARGRPKKRKNRTPNPSARVVATTPDDDIATSAGGSLKRKSTDSADSSPPKRSRKAKSPTKKGTEFFINIGALMRTPSPRRKVTHSSSSEDGSSSSSSNNKRKVGGSATKKPACRKSLNATALRHKFGSRFFRSYVKVRRITDPSQVTVAEDTFPESTKKKRNGKNLSVSFLETVEIFGESSDGEDWVDCEENSFSSTAKSSRLKRLENGNGTVEDDAAKSFSTSTPSCSRTTPERKSGGILKRKEKISFSPLKEDEPSPRKEQLKLANEKIVRLSLEQPHATEEEERERETVPRNNQQPTNLDDIATTSVAPITDVTTGEVNTSDGQDETHNSNESITSSTPIEPKTELMASPPAAENDTSVDNENLVATKRNPEQEEILENEKKSGEEIDQTSPMESKNDPPGTSFEKNKEDDESFHSAVETSSNRENTSTDEEQTVKTKEENNLSEVLDAEAEGESQNVEDATDAEEGEALRGNEQSTELHLEAEIEVNDLEDDEDEKEISETNQVNISNTSDQHFEDASELVATALLDDEERNEADAVLNDVCQMAAAESAALLSESDSDRLVGEVVEYDPRPNDVVDDDDEDFTSVLTHPEVERSLQSAASTLVPNSQEIVVAAAAAASSQSATDIDVTEDTFASVVAEVERLTKDVNPEIYSDDVGITGDDVMMDNVQASNSLDDIFDDDDDGQSHMFLQFPDDIISSLRMSSGSIDIGNDKSLPIQVIETEVMAIPNEPDIIFDKPLGTTASILGTSMATTNDTLAGHGHCSTTDTNSKISLGRIFQSVKSYMMSPGGEKNAAMQD